MWPIATCAAEPVQLLLVEDLRDEPEVAQHGQPAVLGDGDPGRLLAAVLQREQPEVGEPRDVAVGRADAEDAAHQRTSPISTNPRVPSFAMSARGSARSAAPRVGSTRSFDVRVTAAPPCRLRERVPEPAVADVVAERQERRGLPEEADQRASAASEPRAPPRAARRRRSPSAPGTTRTSGTSPTQPTTGVGGIERPSVSL